MDTKSTRGSRPVGRAIWIAASVVAFAVIAVMVPRPLNRPAPASHATPPPGIAPIAKVSIPVDGMICAVCASSVKRAATAVAGVRDAEVDLAGRRATVTYVEGHTTPDVIAAAIARLGYKTGPPVVHKGS